MSVMADQTRLRQSGEGMLKPDYLADIVILSRNLEITPCEVWPTSIRSRQYATAASPTRFDCGDGRS